MTSKALTDEVDEKYEDELAKFITLRIKNAGGALQFQHLIGLLQQLAPATRNAVASSKVQVMKFLKSHPEQFSVDKGIVSVTQTSSVDNINQNASYYEDNTRKSAEVALPATIENGEGTISKLNAEFGFIKAFKPLKAKVYFRASEFGNKNSLLADFDLKIHTEVFFNAVRGHIDSEAQYRATRVWDKPLEKEKATKPSKTNVLDNADSHNKHDRDITGEGVVQKLLKSHGFISTNICHEDIFFHISVLDGNIEQLSDVLKVGDCVEFTATKNIQKDFKIQWQIINVIKKTKKKQKKQPIVSNSENSHNHNNDYSIFERENKNNRSSPIEKIKDNNKGILRGEKGLISPHETSANILFGEKYMNIANGDSSLYYLYGEQVTEIRWEFSDGDEVYFDAEKINSEPGWKAVLVWVGPRPDHVKHAFMSDFKEVDNEDVDGVCKESRGSSTSNLYVSKNPSFQKHSKAKHKTHSSERVNENRYYSSNIKDEYYVEKENKRKYKTTELSSQSDTSQHNKQSSNKYSKGKVEKYDYKGKEKKKMYQNQRNKFSPKKQYRSVSDEENSSSGSETSNPKYSSRHKLQTFKRTNNETEHNTLVKKEIKLVKNSKEDNFRNDYYIEENLRSDYYIEEIQNSSKESESEIEFEDPKEIVVNKEESDLKPSIKVFKDLDCEITAVHCKCAFAQHPDLRKKVCFVANAFFFKGLSVEELQLDDLKEKLSVGKRIKINCFEIVDDNSKLYNVVTLARIGQDPNILENTPQDFILENNLKVTLSEDNNELTNQTPSRPIKKFLSAVESSSDSGDNMELCAPFPKYSSTECTSDDNDDSYSKVSQAGTSKMFETEVPKASQTAKPKVFETEVQKVSQTVMPNLAKKKVLNVSERSASEGLERKELCNNYKLFSEMITKKLETKGLLYESEVDLDILSDEIVDLIVSRKSGKSAVYSKCDMTSSGAIPKHIHKEVQTIVTGEVVAQSIFTEI